MICQCVWKNTIGYKANENLKIDVRLNAQGIVAITPQQGSPECVEGNNARSISG